MEPVYTFPVQFKLSMDNVTVYVETVYNSSNSTNSTRNLNKNRKKSNVYSVPLVSRHVKHTVIITCIMFC